MKITDEMVEPLARYLAKPTEDDLWHWSRCTKGEAEYIEAHWRDYMDDARQYVELVAPMIAASEREECERIVRAHIALPFHGSKWERDSLNFNIATIAEAIRER